MGCKGVFITRTCYHDAAKICSKNTHKHFLTALDLQINISESIPSIKVIQVALSNDTGYFVPNIVHLVDLKNTVLHFERNKIVLHTIIYALIVETQFAYIRVTIIKY